MSNFTTEVRYICETYAGYDTSKEHPDVTGIINEAIPKVFDFSFPIFDESYRQVLEHKILMHYYFQEIGAETVGLWKTFLQRKLNEIMPYYNKLYQSELLEFNPLYSVDYTITHSGTNHNEGSRTDNGDNTGTSSTSAQRTAENKNAYSDTPQGQLSGVDSNTYLTDYRKINDSINGSTSANTHSVLVNNSSSESDGRDAFERRVFGKMNSQSYSDLLKKFRETFLNIDLMIIKELSPLFMGLWE